jgi:hypothetical protein
MSKLYFKTSIAHFEFERVSSATHSAKDSDTPCASSLTITSYEDFGECVGSIKNRLCISPFDAHKWNDNRVMGTNGRCV